jgi:hypothetical protein
MKKRKKERKLYRVRAGLVQPKSFNKENRTELVDCMYNNS